VRGLWQIVRFWLLAAVVIGGAVLAAGLLGGLAGGR
jgi:hypothetical protein